MEDSNRQNGHKRVVVTGLGVISAVGQDVSTFWQSLVNGHSGVDYIASFDTAGFSTRFAAEVKGFDATTFVSRKQARHMDRFTQFAVAASLQAVQSAGLKIDSSNAAEVGVIIGSSVCGLLSVCEQYKILSESGPQRVSPALAPTMTGDAAAVQISLLLGARGLSYAPSSACASGSDAIGQAFNLIRRGEARAMIAGGTEVPVIPLVMAAFNAIRALSVKNDDPRSACRPFDMARDGFVMGEGAAVLLLEEADSARQRGAPILAELVSYGASSDSFHLIQPAPDGEGAARAVQMSLKNAGMEPGDIDYIHAHGTATLLNDRVETRVIKNIFGEKAKQIPVSATKAVTGHLLGAAGSLGAVISVLALREQTVPPTINLTSPDPECDLDYVPSTARKVNIKTAMVNSFGFGGHNNVLIFRLPNGLAH
ncbi:MAG TPA: beta-ketoacyl-ACP synthase II [Dehalococcoidales bacterium]|nr:beta-ketoacyl-ACP synthase II [Dehalococcoidales bacterium]